MTEVVKTLKCYGCGQVFSSFGARANHAKYARNCTPEMRFWGRVDKSGGKKSCWLYQGFRKWDGYGWLCYKGRYMTAHRRAWTLVFGEPQVGKQVLHRCDNPPCCNPAHLWLGTHEDNMHDRTAKGRTRCGGGPLPLIHKDRIRPRKAT